jgi:hypothetical protein
VDDLAKTMGISSGTADSKKMQLSHTPSVWIDFLSIEEKINKIVATLPPNYDMRTKIPK